MEQLNRSISKLKPPTKIISTSSSSSAIATALAVAAAVGNENANTPNNNNNNNNSATTNSATIANGIASRSLNIPSSTLTAHAGAVTAGQKRKPEDTAFEKRTRNGAGLGVGHRSTPAVAATASSLSTRSHVPGTITGAKSLAAQNKAAPELGTGAAATARAPLGRVTAPRGAGPSSTTSSTASRRPAATASRPATSSVAAVQARGRPVATPSTSRMQQLNAQKKQQPSPAQSVSSSTSDLKSEAAAEGNTASTELSSADILNTLAMSKKKKRPAWDTKGRLEDMEELTGTLHQLLHTSATNMTDLTSKLESSESKISELETFRMSLESKVAVKESENKDILQKMKHVEQDLQMTARQHEEEIRLLRSQHSMEMDQIRMTQARLQQETEMLESKLRTTNTQLDHQMQENTSLRSTISTQSSNCLALESDIRALKMKIERTETTLGQRESTIESLERQLSESQMSVRDLEQRIRQEESIRRRLHNTIQELKGNIRVFCRVRPVATYENAPKTETTAALIKYSDQEGREIEFTQTSSGSATGASQAEKSYPFTFDKVFPPTSSQDDVFEEISQLVQSALDGYNVCIFAYGQTGSGKTHTMEGPLNATAETMGMIPRSVLQIYENAKALEPKGWVYSMEGQYVEIYNETINDLLGNEGLDANNNGSNSKKHEIRHGPNGKTTITDITTAVLTSPERVAALLKKAAHNRSVGSTQMNERSSRSHCVFTLRLTGKNTITGEASEGVLNLIDLAGSERLSQSGATGDRLKETQAINKSLSSLGDVIYAISNKDQHIPYRNSKLTYLLQNSLGGNSKTLMFVNVSPLMSNFNETLCSLRFATKVNSCTIGTATKRAVKA